MKLKEGAILTQDNYYKLLVDYAVWRIKKKKNCLMCVVGGTGSGKSIAALFLAEEIQKRLLPDVPFTADNVTFKSSEFMEKTTGETALPSKSTIIPDEFGVNQNSRRSMTSGNILLNDVFQTFRSRQYCVILTTPDFSFMDKTVRKLLHIFLDTKSIDFKNKRNKLKVQIMQNNAKYGKIYYHSLKVSRPDQPTVKIPHIFTGLPSQELWDAYEKKKSDYQDELYERNLRAIKSEENLGELTEKQELVYSMNQKGMKQSEIADAMGLSATIIGKHLMACTKKGYKVQKFYAGFNGGKK